ncbi:MAG: hypothetical protein AAF221_08050 [Pseudomonadota bacterium]
MKRGRSEQLDTLGQEQLPFVSVFLVLLCMLGALNSFSGPSPVQFEAVRKSVHSTFVGREVADALVKQEHSAQTKLALQTLCKDYSGKCIAIESPVAIGTLVQVQSIAFDASAEGLSAQADRFLRAISDVAARGQSTLTLALGADADLGSVRLLILADLLERYSGGHIALVKLPDLVTAQVGLLVMPEA